MLSKLLNQWPSHQPACLKSSYWRGLSGDLWLLNKMAFLFKGSTLELHRCKQLYPTPYSSQPSFSCSISLGCECFKGFVNNQSKVITDDQLILYTYRNGRANKKVLAGTMLTNAQEKAAVVYSNPRRKKYCASVTLKYIGLVLHQGCNNHQMV